MVTGGVQAGGVADWRAPGEVALLVPLPHRTQMRVVVGDEQLDPASLPDAEAVARGWDLQLDRGLRTDLPDPWQEKIDAARADLLLAPPSANAIVALEDWGFDTEAAAAWAASGFRQRRRARRRRRVPDALTTARTFDHAADPAGYLAVMRQVLVDETDGEVMLLSDFPTEWLGQNLAVHDLPLRAGLLSFAIRWHAARPALLWDAPDGVVLRAPALDASWSAAGGAGDTLLAEPPAAAPCDGNDRTRRKANASTIPDRSGNRRCRVTPTTSSRRACTTPMPTMPRCGWNCSGSSATMSVPRCPEIVQAEEEDRLLSMAALRSIRVVGPRRRSPRPRSGPV